MLCPAMRIVFLTFLLIGALDGNTVSVACPDEQAVLNQGVWVLVNGRAHLHAGTVNPQDDVVITNGRVCLSLVPSWQPTEKAAILMEVRAKGQWQLGTASYYGDWTFVDYTVDTAPTKIEVLSWSPREASVRWTFGNHVTGGLRPGSPRVRYPFTKTIWLRRNEYGYFAQIVPLTDLPRESWYNPGASEHELGFGGLWGPGTVETSEGLIYTQDLKQTREANLSEDVDAAEFIRWGDPLRRVLVPLPGGHLLTAVFDPTSFGAVWIHHHFPGIPYGGYLYAAPSKQTKSARSICKYAWRHSPFPLPSVSSAELAICGPEPK